MLVAGIALVVVVLVVAVMASLDGQVFGEKVTAWPERWTKS